MIQGSEKQKKVAPLYDILVKAGGELTPEALYRLSKAQRKKLPENERVEAFYIALTAEIKAGLMIELRPTIDKVLLRAVEQVQE